MTPKGKKGTAKTVATRGAQWWKSFHTQAGRTQDAGDYVAVFNVAAKLKPTQYQLGGKVVTL